jgi:signal transduction histidine kinase
LTTLPNKPDENLLSQVFSTNESILIPDVKADPTRSHLIPNFDKLRKKVDFSSVVIVPMSVRNKVLGTIGLSRESSNSPITAEDMRLLKNLADLAALAISNSRLYQELERALRDEQTMRVQLIQSEKHRAVSRMVASVAHEINNPIQTVRNCLYLTQQDLPADSNIHEYLNMAFLETKRISNLVTQLREVYRPQRISQVEPVDLVVILDEVHQFIHPHLIHEKVNWCQSPASQPVLVSGIADQLKQVFLNICMNAIEAMQPAGGDLFVSLDVTENPRQAHVSFRDKGTGIPLGLLDQIFEPFFTTKDDGTGLGLSICYDVVRSHSGQITVESQPGEGATFTVILPLAGIAEDVDDS